MTKIELKDFPRFFALALKDKIEENQILLCHGEDGFFNLNICKVFVL